MFAVIVTAIEGHGTLLMLNSPFVRHRLFFARLPELLWQLRSAGASTCSPNVAPLLGVSALHLALIGALIIRAQYIPWWLGIILIIDGSGCVVTVLRPYLYPNVNVNYPSITALGELVFMVWLLIMGWRIKEPQPVVDVVRAP